ncbi:enoyl-CoA hydratase-related protein [Leekyejoonella antrihumi]|uniref:Enoyl-CoA hydratase n=1 Tax=Leekyejoonella antrihumi TaxID=1660198 RepID=A0A563DTV1_9MICO|nr:enoyl-CoA hydratase-related protein [Leekyejoonella antrihumi]TWP33619.1 enoyl-CoA hydratase [Leekyejoonella antrihumi]
MPYEQILVEVAERIATITLNRPQARNGFTTRMADEIAGALREAGTRTDVQVVVLTGAGDDFCVGADLSGGRLNVGEDGGPTPGWVEPASRVTGPLFVLDKPVIAAVHGAAVGVGSTMILPADYRIAAQDSRFGFVFSRRGIYPEGGSTWFLPRLVGMTRASDWMISGRLVSAQEALDAGLLTSVHPAESVLEAAYAVAHDLIEHTAPVSTAVIRRAMWWGMSQPSPDPVFALDTRLIASTANSADATEGVRSFLEHRAPDFPGCLATDLPDFVPWEQSD